MNRTTWYAGIMLGCAAAAGLLTFTIVDTVVLRGVPFANGERLVPFEGQGFHRTYPEPAYRA
jgi:hypothetical protein